MPKTIKLEDVERMFPFEFFDELSQQLKTYTLLNPVFLLQETFTEDERRDKYYELKNSDAAKLLSKNNLIEVEPYGELLILETVIQTKDKKSYVEDSANRNQQPLSILVAQLYDSSDEAVFAKDVTNESLAQIPEVLWDDPNLLLAVISFEEKGAEIGVIKIPSRIEKRLFEEINTEDN